jgi:tRNA A-37 threonylcarbamoyl transferase component Bud32
LLEDEFGRKTVLKCYRPGKRGVLVRELLALRYLSRLSVVPQVLSCALKARTLLLSYIPGDRVLEWVLNRYGDRDLDLAQFASCHGLQTNEQVQRAFARFRAAPDPEAIALRGAIVETYRILHRTGFLHGDPGPRNIIYDGQRANLIDFDHTRPSFAPARVDSRALRRWYGIDMEEQYEQRPA